jgi:4'-phosphopantetheinyl transferase
LSKISLPLESDSIHIYILSVNDINIEDINILNKIEKENAACFKFSIDRQRYQATHIFLRHLLSYYGQLAPEQWTFSKNSYGKPAVSNFKYQWLQFNLSYSKNFIAYAITNNRSVGIDIEKYRYIEDLQSLCYFSLSPVESENILSIHDINEQQQKFFTYWTLKESYIKARGMGLSIPLQEFSFTQIKEEWYLHCNTVLHDNGLYWKFVTFQFKQYCLSIGVRK